MQDNEILNKESDNGINLPKILGYLRAYWWLFAASLVACLLVAFIYLHCATPIYKVSAKVLLQDSEKGGAVLSPADMLADFGMRGQVSNVENEIEVMSSMSVVRGAVVATDLYVGYQIGEENVPRESSPVGVRLENAISASYVEPLELDFTFGQEGPVTVSYAYVDGVSQTFTIEVFPSLIETPVGNVLVMRNDNIESFVGGIKAVLNPIDNVADSYKNGLSVAPLSKTSSVAELSFNTPKPSVGVAFLNAVMTSFNDVTNENKRQVARRTEAFISERLDTLRRELEIMEGSLAAYKKKNELIDPKLDATQITQKKAEYIKMLEQIDLKIKASKFLNDFVNNPSNDMSVIPASFGVELDPALVRLIDNYNAKVVERKGLLYTVTAENPTLKNLTTLVRTMQDDLRAALKALAKSLDVERKSVSILAEQYTGRFEMSPEVERQLLSITRECTIKSDLYVMLLQKYEETLLSIEVTSDNLNCIDAPYVAGKVAPSGKKIYLMSFVLGLLIPVVFIYLRELIRNKFATVEEVQATLDIPYIGTIPVKGAKAGLKKVEINPIVVERNNNDVMAEAFRTMRTNLQFLMKKNASKVIMFTSTVSGEGKTFVASNLAVSMVLLGKKVLLVGGDIRRPRLAEVFKFSSSCHGLTSYLCAPEDEVEMLDNLIIPSNVVDGLDLLPAGIVPPNPAELLASPNLDRAVEYLKEKYDYIIFDTAPAGLVADSLIVHRVADIVAYVVRLNYTHKADAAYIKSLVVENKLGNVALVVNGDDLSRKTYGSRGSNRYSYVDYSNN